MTTTATDLRSRYDDPWDALADMHTRLKEKDDRIEEQAERIDELERELDNQATNIAGAFTKLSAIDDRLDDLEDERANANASADAETIDKDESDESETETPLETICALPEHVATRELTANQERARFLAKDVQDYAEKCPAGLVLDSRAIKRVITAKEGERPHTQTVARVMGFLNQLGKDDVDLRERRGRKLVAIDPEAADRLSTLAEAGAGANHDRCDRGSATGPTESVIGSV